MPLASPRSRAALVAAIITAILVTDQAIKVWVKTHFLLHEQRHITDWFYLAFTENRGMAFGMSFIGTTALTVFRIAAVAYFSVLLARAVRRPQYSAGFLACGALIVAGAAGNIVDNCFYGLIFSASPEYIPFLHDVLAPAQWVALGEGYGAFFSGLVVDMFYFPLFTWPEWVPLLGGEVFFNAIFNFADAAISCGAIAALLFYRNQVSEDLLHAKAKEVVTQAEARNTSEAPGATEE